MNYISRGKTEGVAANTVKVAEGVGEEEGTGLLAAHPVGRGPRPRALAPEPLEVVGVGAQEVGTTDACSTPKSPCQRPSLWEQIFPTMPGLGTKSVQLVLFVIKDHCEVTFLYTNTQSRFALFVFGCVWDHCA